MEAISVRNFRCFGDTSQTAELAPVTLLVGENSSGKTSLMAMIRALWDAAFDDRVPDFKEPPLDLGSFNEIAHHRGARGSRAAEFEGWLKFASRRRRSTNGVRGPVELRMTFAEQWSAPVPIRREVKFDDHRLTQFLDNSPGRMLEIETSAGTWTIDSQSTPNARAYPSDESMRPLNSDLFIAYRSVEHQAPGVTIRSHDSSSALTSEHIIQLRNILKGILSESRGRQLEATRPFVSAPIRSEPQRTYDPRRSARDAYGKNVPTYLAQLSERDERAWEGLKSRLERFGRDAALFDELRIRRLGKTDTDPFQVQVRKFGSGRKGPFRSMVDVGYGISQVLPVALELLEDDGPRILLLQQPEVHLHPSAQAALGSLLCEVAGNGPARRRRQLIVETHSDYMIDRVRMAVADPQMRIGPDDVSIVYFERSGLEVFLHSLSIDDLGNINGAPPNYRQFFLQELQRSVGY